LIGDKNQALSVLKYHAVKTYPLLN